MPTNNQLTAQAVQYVSLLLKGAVEANYDDMAGLGIDAARAFEEALGTGRDNEQIAVILSQAVAVVLSERYYGSEE